MNKSEIISKFKACFKGYTPPVLTCVGIVGSVMSNQISITRLRTLREAQDLSKTALATYKQRNCNNWRKIHGKPMNRRKQLEKVKSFV